MKNGAAVRETASYYLKKISKWNYHMIQEFYF
jgi:hypothetical protein